MPSPFPGMNPYLEQSDLWQDFHNRYIGALGDALAALVRPRFFVKIEEHLLIHDHRDNTEEYTGNADVSVGSVSEIAGHGGGVGVLLAPVRVKVPVTEFERQPYLEIHDRQSREIVSVLELLSPGNKKNGALRRQYMYKRSRTLKSWASYVEIDLLRGGLRMPLEPPPTSDYYVMVSRYEDRPEVGCWPISLRDPLPTIPVPLPSPENEVLLDLQAIFHVVFDRAYYQDHIYSGKPAPRLSAEDAKWAASLIGPQS